MRIRSKPASTTRNNRYNKQPPTHGRLQPIQDTREYAPVALRQGGSSGRARLKSPPCSSSTSPRGSGRLLC
jgi:hypothetical protein